MPQDNDPTSSRSKSKSIPRIISRTELVTVPVIVKRDGKHVAGLTKNDFEVKEDGQVKTVATFEEFRNAPSTIKPIQLPNGIYSNEVITTGQERLVIIVIDQINTPYLIQSNVKTKLLEFLDKEYKADQPTMLVAMQPGGLRVLHDFTSDPNILKDIIHKLKANQLHDNKLDNQIESEKPGDSLQIIDPIAEMEAMRNEFFDVKQTADKQYKNQYSAGQFDETIFQLQQLAHALGSVHSMKTLIWAMGGFDLPWNMGDKASKMKKEYLDTLDMLSASSITVYPIDVTLSSDEPIPTWPSPASYQNQVSSGPPPRDRSRVQNFMEIAKMTGGDYCLMRKDYDNCFPKAVDYSAEYYMLSYYTKPADKEEWRKIRVKVNGNGLHVHARDGYFSLGPVDDPDKRRRADIAQAFATPVEVRGLPFSVRWDIKDQTQPINETTQEKPVVLKDAAAKAQPALASRMKRNFEVGIGPSTLTVDSQDNNHIQLFLVAAAVNKQGKILADMSQQIDLHPGEVELQRMRKNGFIYAEAVNTPPNTEKVRFILRDEIGKRVGTVTVPIENVKVN